MEISKGGVSAVLPEFDQEMEARHNRTTYMCVPGLVHASCYMYISWKLMSMTPCREVGINMPYTLRGPVLLCNLNLTQFVNGRNTSNLLKV